MLGLSQPTLLTENHNIIHFSSCEASLDEWLKRRALKNQTSGASRCFVVGNNQKVVGFYSLSAGAINHEFTTKSIRRNMPNPIPILLLGRLAVDKTYHNRGIGSGLLRDAMIRSVNIATETGVFAILVHALSPEAKQFYLSRGFVESLLQPMTLIMTLQTISTIIAEPIAEPIPA